MIQAMYRLKGKATTVATRRSNNGRSQVCINIVFTPFLSLVAATLPLEPFGPHEGHEQVNEQKNCYDCRHVDHPHHLIV